MDLNSYLQKLENIETMPVIGRICRADGLIVESEGPPVSVGDSCEILKAGGGDPIEVEVIGFRERKVLSMPINDTGGIQLGDRVISLNRRPVVSVGEGLLGRVIDGNGLPLDGKGPIPRRDLYPLQRTCQNPLARTEINTPLGTGIRAVDGLLTVGRGQRIGIFGGSGVGKSTLLGMMAKNTEATVSVIALVGERSREVNAFIEDDLGEKGLERSVVVVSTSDNPPLMRIRAALVATSVAEYFKDRGHDVLLVMDSVTRVAMAQREIGLAAGEPPSSKGYTPSVFALMPRIFERAGNFENGSITGFYTILVEGDDMNEPIADAVRGLLDGHVVLSRKLAGKNHFPAISVLESLSRLMPALVDKRQLINIGAYKKGTNPKIDFAIEKEAAINSYLKQEMDDASTFESALGDLLALLDQ